MGYVLRVRSSPRLLPRLASVAYRRPYEYLTLDAVALVQRPGGGGTSLGKEVVSIPSIMYEIKKYSRTF
jgi:hypothetical protein